MIVGIHAATENRQDGPDAVIVVGTEVLELDDGERLVADGVVGGLTLLQRALRSAQLAGARRLHVLTPDPDAVRRLVASDPDLELPLETIESGRPLREATDLVREHADRLPESFWLATADRVISPRDFVQSSPVRASDLADQAGVAGSPDEEPGIGPRIRSAADLRQATVCLVRTLRKPLARNGDGVTAYFVNRPISLRISRLLVSTPVTPNQVTTLALLVGLAAAVIVASGVWGWMVLGGVLLQLSSILDGVDGEIARMRLRSSRRGEWYDTVCDDLINTAFMVGLGVAMYRRSGEIVWAQVTAVAAIVAIVVSLLLYRQLLRQAIASHNDLQWGFESGGGGLVGRLARPILVAFSFVAKRDTYTLVLLLLLVLDRPTFAFLFMAGGATAILVGFVIQQLAARLRVG